MRTPPITRTKDDANKELHEVELKINLEKQKLEIIQRERGSTESAFEDRERRCIKKEENLVDIVVGLISKKEETVNDIKENEYQISRHQSLLNSQKDEIELLDTEIKNKTILVKEMNKLFEKHKSENEKNIKLIEKIVENYNNDISRLNKEVVSMENIKSKLVLEINEKEKLQLKKEKELKEREKTVANKESDFRVIRGRLAKKYKNTANEVELKVINK